LVTTDDDDTDTDDDFAAVVLTAAAEEPARLRSHQIGHAVELRRILDMHGRAVDTSVMGSGKTYVACHLAAVLGLNLVVVCPATVTRTWKRVAAEFCLPRPVTLSFESLRGSVGKQSKHGLLVRADSGGEHNVTTFKPSDVWKFAVDAGVLFVIDEIQRVKNTTATRDAVQALAVAIRCPSRILFLSGTPFDKKHHASNLLQLLFSQSCDLLVHSPYKAHTKELSPGTLHIIERARLLDPARTRIACEKDHDVYIEGHGPAMNFDALKPASIQSALYELYVNVFQPALVRSMPPPVILGDLHCYNTSYAMPEKDRADLQVAVLQLKKALRRQKEGVALLADSGFAAVTIALQKMEVAKAPTFIAIAKKQLAKDPNTKIVLAFNYFMALDIVMQGLADYSPLLLCGRQTDTEKHDAIAAFQTHSAEHRVLCGIMAVMDVGIDLDDTHGGFPRVAFANTTYRPLSMHQFTRRFYRTNTRSDAEVNFVYGAGVDEPSIASCLKRKTAVMTDILPTQVEAGYVFPGDYEQRTM